MLLLFSWIKIECLHRGFLFASASPLWAEIGIPKTNETKTSRSLSCVVLPRPCKGPESQFHMIIWFCTRARRRGPADSLKALGCPASRSSTEARVSQFRPSSVILLRRQGPARAGCGTGWSGGSTRRRLAFPASYEPSFPGSALPLAPPMET